MKKIIHTPLAPQPVGPYSQAVKASNFLFVSGQLPIDPKTGKIVTPDIRGQTKRVMENIKAILQASNYTLHDVVQVNVYLSSLAMFSDFNRTYAEYFEGNFPARVTVEANLPSSALLEISAIALKER